MSDSIHYGLNQDLGTWRDEKYVRCARCGFTCHLDRDTRGHERSRAGWGTSYVSDITVDDTRVAVDSASFTNSAVTLQNVHVNGYFIGGPSSSLSTSSTGLISMYGEGTQRETVTQGCPFCGTLLYWK